VLWPNNVTKFTANSELKANAALTRFATQSSSVLQSDGDTMSTPSISDRRVSTDKLEIEWDFLSKSVLIIPTTLVVPVEQSVELVCLYVRTITFEQIHLRHTFDKLQFSMIPW